MGTTSTAVNANSVTEKLKKEFNSVQAAASAFNISEAKSEALLSDAMLSLFEFGERMMGTPDNYQEDDTLLFLQSMGVKINKSNRTNPYIGLTQKAFGKASASTLSQRAKVLAYARHQRTAPKQFRAWLAQTGIKGRHKEAVAHFGGTAAHNNEQARDARFEAAKNALNARPVLANFNLTGVPEGFALLLARVEANGDTFVLDVPYHNDQGAERVKAAILPHDPSGSAARSVLISQPLGQLWRATDLIMRLTGDGLANVMIRNTDDNGAPVCIVQAALGDRYGAWAEVRIAGHVEGIALDQLRLLNASAPAKPKGKDTDAAKVELSYHFEAELFRDEFSKHANWRIDGMTINADGLASGIRLHANSPASAMRIPRKMPDTSKTVTLDREGMASLLTYVAAASSEKERGKVAVAMPEVLCVALDGGKLYLSMPRTQAERACIGSGTHAPDPDKRQLSVAYMKRVTEVLFDLGVDATGCFIDDDITDVALRLRADLDGASLSIIIPTRSDQTVNETLRLMEVA